MRSLLAGRTKSSLREALGTSRLVMAIIAFFVIPGCLVIGFMYVLGLFSAYSLIWASLTWLVIVLFLAYVAMTIKFDNAVSEKTVRVSASMEQISEVIPRIVAENRWKLAEADRRAGCYKVRIGMTLQTWAQTMLIRLNKTDEMSTKVDVRCEALGQSYDWGRNAAVIDRFCSELENTLKLRV